MTTLNVRSTPRGVEEWIYNRRAKNYGHEIYRSTSQSGFRSHSLHLAGKQMVGVRLSLPHGWARESHHAGSLLCALRCVITEGAAGKPELSKMLSYLAASASVSVGATTSSIGWLAPTDTVDEVTKLVIEALTRPAFSAATISTVSATFDGTLAAAARDVGVLASSGASTTSRDESVTVRRAEGLVGGTKPVLASVQSAHDALIDAQAGELVVAGDRNHHHVVSIVGDMLTDWTSPTTPSLPSKPVSSRRSLIRLNSARAAWACSFSVSVASLREAVLLEAGLTALAGWSGSLLYEDLVSRAGMSYSLQFDLNTIALGNGVTIEVTMGSVVAPHQATEAWRIVKDTLDNVANNGLPPERLRTTLSWLTSIPRLLSDTPNQLTDWYTRWLQANSNVDTPDQRGEVLATATGDEINGILATLLKNQQPGVCLVDNPSNTPLGFKEVEVWGNN